MSRRIWAEMLKHKLRRLLAGQRLSRFSGGGAKRVTSRSTKETHWWSHSKQWERRPTGRGKTDSQDLNISLLLGQPQNNSDAKKEGLDVILDVSAV